MPGVAVGFKLHSRLLFWGGIFGLLLMLPLAQPPVESVEAVEGPSRHLVKVGDTLSSIALDYGVAIDELVSLNGISDPNRISEGSTLKLPTGVGASGNKEYIVRPGDSLSSIAAANGMTLAALKQANPLDNPDRLKVGQRLSLPAGSSAPASAASAAPKPSASAPAAGTAQAAVLSLIQTK